MGQIVKEMVILGFGLADVALETCTEKKMHCVQKHITVPVFVS